MLLLRRPDLLKHSQPIKHNGFTLIELLVVLAIVGTLGALVAPNIWEAYQRASERFAVIEYGSEIGALRRELMESRSSLVIVKNALTGNTSDQNFPELPSGWLVVGNSQILLLPTGVTTGGVIELESPTGLSWTLGLQPLDGSMSVDLR